MLEVMKDRRQADGSPSPIDPIEHKIRGMSHQDAVKTVIRERFQPISGLRFQFVQQGGDVLIGFVSGQGSWSMLGTESIEPAQKGQKTMNLGWMDAATIMHEIGHVLGMIHEHDNPKSNPIHWNLPVLYEWGQKTQGWSKEQVDENIVKRYETTQLNASTFDPDSIMLYFFPGKLTTDDKSTNINQRLSLTDVKWISKMYPGGSETPEHFYRRIYGTDSSTGGFLERVHLLKLPWLLIWVVPLIIIIIVFLRRRRKTNKQGTSGRYK